MDSDGDAFLGYFALLGATLNILAMCLHGVNLINIFGIFLATAPWTWMHWKALYKSVIT